MGVQINGDTGNISATKADYSGNVTIGGTLTYEDVTNVDSVGLITARQGIKVGSGVGVAASISVDGNAEFAGIVTATSFIGSGSGLTGVASTDNIRTNTNATFLQNINVSGTSTVSSNVTSSSGNFVPGTAGKGLDLSAQDISSGITTAAFVNASRTGTITSEIFKNYEEGTFIPELLYIAQPTYNSRNGKYTRIGNLVYITVQLDISSLPSDGSAFTIGGIPYTHESQGTLVNNVCLFSVGNNTTLLGSKISDLTNIRMTNKGSTPPPSADVNYTGGIQLREGTGSIQYSECQSSGVLDFAAMYMIFI